MKGSDRLSLFTKVGEAAVQASVDNGGGSDSPIVSFKTGTTIKVGVKSVNDVAEYYGYGLYKKVAAVFKRSYRSSRRSATREGS